MASFFGEDCAPAGSCSGFSLLLGAPGGEGREGREGRREVIDEATATHDPAKRRRGRGSLDPKPAGLSASLQPMALRSTLTDVVEAQAADRGQTQTGTVETRPKLSPDVQLDASPTPTLKPSKPSSENCTPDPEGYDTPSRRVTGR